MARSIGMEFEGDLYHRMARGKRREFIFLDNDDWRMFFATLEAACEMAGGGGWLGSFWFSRYSGGMVGFCSKTGRKDAGREAGEGWRV